LDEQPDTSNPRLAIGFPGTALIWWQATRQNDLRLPARAAIVPQALMLVLEALVAMALWDGAIRIASFIWKNREPGDRAHGRMRT
jgi:hypothetical protein